MTKTISKEKNAEGEWLCEEALQIAEKKRKIKSKGEKKRYTQLNAEFQRKAKKEKKTSVNEQWREVEENTRMRMNRDLFKKIGEIKGIFQARMDMIKDWNVKDLTKAGEIKKRWQKYMEEIHKKCLNDVLK